MVTELRICSNFFLWHRVCLRSNSDFMTHVRHVHMGTCTCRFMTARAKTFSVKLEEHWKSITNIFSSFLFLLLGRGRVAAHGLYRRRVSDWVTDWVQNFHKFPQVFKVEFLWIPTTESAQFSTSAPLGALVLLVASDSCLLVSLSLCPYLLMSNSGATSKCNYDGFR